MRRTVGLESRREDWHVDGPDERFTRIRVLREVRVCDGALRRNMNFEQELSE
jgi:hypothetical protein